ncbi:MAG: cation:proton antiporter, partial [Chloroflexi bacterium]|nr:cation:proton antiporter [Chloroflexota bacterium]
GIARAGSVAFADLAFVIAKGLFFVAAATILPPIVLGRHEFRIYRLRHRNALLSVAILACVGFSVLAEQVGLAAIVGAFLAGMGFANVEGHSELKKDISSIGDFLIPLFFVAIGMQVNLGSILSGSVLVFGLVMTAVAIAGKMIGCGIGAKGLGPRSALIIGVGMVPRGEVGLIVATIGMTVGALSKDLVATIVLVSLLSTIVVPPLLPMLFKNEFFKSKSPCPGD